MSSSGVEAIAAGGGLALVAAGYWIAIARGALSRRRAERSERVRAKQTEAAALEASFEDRAFAPDVIRKAVHDILARAAEVWRGEPSAAHADARVILGWARSFQESVGSGVRLAGPPSIDLLRVVNRPGESEDRIVLRVRLRLSRGRRGSLRKPRTVTIDQRWTLARASGGWTLSAIEPDPLAPRLLNRPLVAGVWQDEDRIREESLLELAAAEATPSPPDPSELVSPEAPPRTQLLELAEFDARFSPDLLAATLDRIVEAWEEAGTGSQAPLASVASPDAIEQLLHPLGDPRPSLRIHDPHVDQWEVVELNLNTHPPQVVLSLTVSAVRYLVMGTERVVGSREIAHEMELVWRLKLTGRDTSPWQLTASTNPAADIPNIEL